MRGSPGVGNPRSRTLERQRLCGQSTSRASPLVVDLSGSGRPQTTRAGAFPYAPRVDTFRIKSAIQRALARRGYEIRRHDPLRYLDMSADDWKLWRRVENYTQTSPERVAALGDAVEYVVRRGMPGDFAECGVWRGGSSMAIALALQRLGVADRQLWLYDTFGEMPAPSEYDGGMPPEPLYQINNSTNTSGLTLPDVRRAMESTGFPLERVTYVAGLVEETLPGTAPEQLALLRLDTDWYESTHHELVHLYPRLVPGGVLLVDDYGFFPGARKAVDEFFADTPVLLARLDHGARIAVKL
jgi:O-methyltransferase